jgi:three-Cys-motif partner protein
MRDHDTYWQADGNYLPAVKPHTKAKHQILADYVKNWIVTLCGNNMGKRKTVTLIDGFCGGGMYVDPENNNELWKGSPIRIIAGLFHSHEGPNMLRFQAISSR